jgi:pimeloyl-ACP methyl ester carboxylesterase
MGHLETDLPAQTLLLLHGALGAASQLDPLRHMLRRLAGDSLTLHTIDFEGHGTRAALQRPFRMVHFVGNVREFLDHRRVERASIFGYSMGGYVALCLAALEPQRVAKAMTLGTKFRWTPEIAEREGRMLDPRRIEEKVPRFARALAARHTGAGWEAVLAQTREMLLALGAGPDLDDETLGHLALPVRIGIGDRDATVTVEESAAVSRILQNGELEVLPGTPHPLEKVPVERLARSIIEFVTEASRQRATA